MKSIKNITSKLVFLFFLVFVGCNEDNFLEQVNPNAITTDTFWQTERQFNAALTTVYGATQFQAISGGLLDMEFNRSDEGGTESWYRPSAFRNLTYNDGQYYVSDKWNELYVGVFRANQVIQYIQDVNTSEFSGNSKVEIEAQARFLRAFFYFELAHNYGGAIIHTEVANTNDDLHKPFSPIETVNSTVIIPDLEFAIDNLPLMWTDENDLGRITSGAATALLGKVYLYDQNWNQAATLFKAVIDSDVYSLVSDFSDNITHENEFNSESLFEVNYSFDINPGAPGAAVDDTPNETGAESTTLGQGTGQLQFNAFNTVLASYALHELFWYDEVDPTNPANNGNMQSKRMTYSIVPINGEEEYYGLPIGEKGGWAFGQSAYVKKHSNWYHLDAEPQQSRSGINFRHIRYSDILLMYAEAINENGDFNTAMQYIDLVRSRAGVKTLQQYLDENSGMFPQLHVSVQVHGAHPMVTPSVETIRTHIQRVERPLELCFEGHRWKDLVRWGIVKEVFDELRADEEWRENNKDILNISGSGVAPLFIKERIRPDFLLCSQNYNSAQHDYLPIPASEVQANDKLNNN